MDQQPRSPMDGASVGNQGNKAKIKSEVKSQASHLADQAKEMADSRFSEKKTEAVGQIQHLTGAIRAAADHLAENDETQMERWVQMAADRVEDLSRNLEKQDLGSILRETQKLGRRNPALFLAGTVALGFLAARFLKATPDHDDDLWDGRREAGFESDLRSPVIDRDDPYVSYAEE